MLLSNRFSGAENVVCQIIYMYKDQNIDFVYSSQDGPIREALEERDVEFYPIRKTSIREFHRVIKELKPDIIHAHDMGASFFAALSCGKIPLVSHIHNNAFDSRGISIKSILYFIAAQKAKHIFWVSQSSFDGYAFHKHFRNKSTVLYNIIDIQRLKEKMMSDYNHYDYDIVYLGRLTYQKNPQRLIEVLEKIVEKKPETRVAIIGTGDLENEIKQMVLDKGLSENIIFLGFQSNPTKMLHDAKVMIMTSRWEGTPMCALEAMALGVPIVSTPTDGLCELVKEGETGFLSDNNDKLSESCLKIICDDELHNRMSVKSSQRAVDLMSVKKYKSELTKVYQSVVMKSK